MRLPANSARTRCQALASLALPIARAKPALTGAVKPRRNTLSQPRRLAWIALLVGSGFSARVFYSYIFIALRNAIGLVFASGSAPGSEHARRGAAPPGAFSGRLLRPRQPSWLGQRVAARLHRAGERGLRPRDWQRERCERLLSTVLYHLRARAQGAKVRRMTEPSLRPRRSSIGGVYL